MKLLEVCVDSLASARAAKQGGADRLEFCSALAVGGLTPYADLLRQIKAELDLPVRCLMRPRAGDFLYTRDELELLCRQIETLRSAGADGFVIGALTPEGALDLPAMHTLLDACGGAPVTLHRCIDVSRDLCATYRAAAALGIDTVLTSGGAGSCRKGISQLAALLRLRDELDGPEVLIGAGVNAAVIDELRAALPGARAFHASCKTLLESGAAIAARDEAADRAYTAVMQDDAARVKNLCYYLKEGDWDKSLAALDAVLTGWRRAGSVKGGKDANQCASAASQLRDRAKDQMTSLQKDVLLCTVEEFAADRRRAAPLVAALVRATQAFADSCFAAKCAEKVLDYADYEHLTLDLLLTESNERTPLCATVSARYAAVLVDEYQDTNALQDAIYFALARPEADNLFFVGDIKQSIYRFRLADPGIFVDKQQRWQPHPQPAPLPSTLALDANFRSAPGVIAGINYLFETFFSRGLGGVDYGDGQRLVVGGDKDAAYQGMCEIDVIDGADVDGDAAVIARRIAEMVGQGFPVRGKDGPRPCRYDDFCILLRGRKGFAAYEGALRTAGIPVFADSATDLLDEPHIRPFAALLRVIDNPAQDIPLAAVLLSPMFPYTADDLVALRRARAAGEARP